MFVRFEKRCVCSAASLIVAAGTGLYAGGVSAQSPSGGVVTRGTASITTAGDKTTISQSSPRAIIDWRNMDVGSGRTLEFAQPDARSATLNRVRSASETRIDGRITAPGTVIIQNNSGVIFSQGARVDVGSLVATSRNVDADRFMGSGRVEISGGETPGARVRNEGAITIGEAGLAAFVGGQVSNAGAIVARRGEVVLSTNTLTTIDLAGDGIARIAVSDDAPAGSRIDNGGSIDAAGGRVLLSAGTASGLLDSVINTTGVIRAASATETAGRISLVGGGGVKVDGELSAGRGSVEVAGGSVRITKDGLSGTLAAGGDVRVQSATDVDVTRTIAWAGDGDLSISAGRDVTIDGALRSKGSGDVAIEAQRDIATRRPVLAEGDGDLQVIAGRNLDVEASITAATGDILLSAQTGDLSIDHTGSDRMLVSAFSGDLSFLAPLGSIDITNNSLDGTGLVVRAPEGSLTAFAGGTFSILANDAAQGGAVWFGRYEDGAALSVTAQRIELTGFSVDGADATIASGPGGFVDLFAHERIVIGDGVNAEARVVAANGADLTMRAPHQDWFGRVRAARIPDSGPSGGDVLLSGEIVIDYRIGPSFNLGPDQSFALSPTGPDGTPSSISSTVPIVIRTRGEGEISFGGPLAAPRVRLFSEERVALGPDAGVTGTSPFDPVIIAAGRRFVNEAGPDALAASDPSGRWLLFVDGLDGIEGATPESGAFDLYGRAADETDPLPEFDGNRIVYLERPEIVVSGTETEKLYGEAALATVEISGVRPRDAASLLFAAAPTAETDGAVSDAPVGDYAVSPVAALSERAIAQGYDLAIAPGLLRVTPRALTVAALDAERAAGAPNPDFEARIDGFAPGEYIGDLHGELAFTTVAGIDSRPGEYPVFPEGLTSENYMIAFTPGTLVVTPAPVPPTAPPPAVVTPSPAPAATQAPQHSLTDQAASAQVLAGAPPLTLGDASFRTTVAQGPEALSDPFTLPYSLGVVVQTAPDGFVPADSRAARSCGGPINLGFPLDGCRREELRETYWTTIVEGE